MNYPQRGPRQLADLDRQALDFLRYCRAAGYARYLRFKHHIDVETFSVDGKEYRGFYHLHVRKTGGTTINRVFMEHVTGGDVQGASRSILAVGSAKWRMKAINGKIVSCWSRAAIQAGCFWYGWSHLPMHKLDIHPKLYTITCLRDPIARLHSHYKMLLDYAVNGKSVHVGLEREKGWLGPRQSFTDFVENVPREHLLNQLYMFSSSLDVSEAIDNLAEVNTVLQTETLNTEGFTALNRLVPELNLNQEAWYRKSPDDLPSISKSDWEFARDRLDPEYRMFDLLPNQSANQTKIPDAVSS